MNGRLPVMKARQQMECHVNHWGTTKRGGQARKKIQIQYKVVTVSIGSAQII